MAIREQISAGDYLRVIFKRKALIIGVFLIISVGIGVTVFRQPIIYEVSGKILVTRSRADLVLTAAAAGSGGPGFVMPQQQDLTAEVELLKSRNLSKAVARELEAPQKAQSPAVQAPVMLANLLPIPASLTTRLPPWLGGSSDAGTVEEPSPSSRQNRVAAGIQRGLTIQVLPNSSVIEVRYRNTDPERAVDVVNTLLNLYLDRSLEIRRPPGVTAFFAEQRDLYDRRLRESEEAMRQFEGRTALINTGAQLEVYTRQLAEAELTLQKVHYNVLDKRQKLSSTKAHLTSIPERIVSSQTMRYNPMIDSLQMRLVELEMERDKLLQSYTEQDRRVRDSEERIAALKQRLAEQRQWVPGSETSQIHPLRASLQESLMGTETSLDRLSIDQSEATDLIAMLRRRIGEMAQLAVDRAELTREVKANEEAYLLYRKRVEEGRISEAMDQQKIVNVIIAEEAATPLSPITSKNLSYAFALMVGLVAGVGGGYLREFFDNSVKSAADVTSSTALPVLASIPEEKRNGKTNGGQTGIS